MQHISIWNKIQILMENIVSWGHEKEKKKERVD
jgi:hypothetical protein